MRFHERESELLHEETARDEVPSALRPHRVRRGQGRMMTEHFQGRQPCEERIPIRGGSRRRTASARRDSTCCSSNLSFLEGLHGRTEGRDLEETGILFHGQGEELWIRECLWFLPSPTHGELLRLESPETFLDRGQGPDFIPGHRDPAFLGPAESTAEDDDLWCTEASFVPHEGTRTVHGPRRSDVVLTREFPTRGTASRDLQDQTLVTVAAGLCVRLDEGARRREPSLPQRRRQRAERRTRSSSSSSNSNSRRDGIHELCHSAHERASGSDRSLGAEPWEGWSTPETRDLTHVIDLIPNRTQETIQTLTSSRKHPCLGFRRREESEFGRIQVQTQGFQTLTHEILWDHRKTLWIQGRWWWWC